MKKLLIAVVACAAFALPSSPSTAFELTFDWGKIPKCTSGNPGRVPNPVFSLKDVPEGTTKLKFTLNDRDAPGFVHGGGTVAYAGGNSIQPGAFKYLSPCPPGGKHNYTWTVNASNAGGKKIGSAKASQKYP